MSHKRYADFDDLCVDADGNEIIVLHESNSPSTCEPYVPEENVEFKYIYGKGILNKYVNFIYFFNCYI